MPTLKQDLRFALGTGRGRIVSALAVLSLALGIAGNAVAFSALEAFILRPLPYPDADRLVLLGEREERMPALTLTSLISSYAIWAEYRDRSTTLRDWAAVSPRRVSLATADGPVPLTAGHVSERFFDLLGARPALGRLPDGAEVRAGGPRVVLLSWELWQQRGADAGVLGTTLRLDGEAYEVIGVLERGFEFILPRIAVWLPLRDDPSTAARGTRNVVSVARMAPGVSMAAVKAEIAAIAAQIQDDYPDTHRGWTADAMNLRTEFPDPQSRLYMSLIQASVLLVLLIVCANIVNLLLVRAQDRRREIALRTALGATRFGIVAQLTRENMALAALGAMLGLGLAHLAIGSVADQFGTVLAGTYHPALSARVILATALTAMLCGVLFGVAPAVQALRQDQAGVLRHGHGGGRAQRRVSTVLVSGQVALCFVALAAGGVLARSFLDVRGQDPGYDAKQVLAVELVLPHWRAGNDASLLEAVTDRMSVLPEVVVASIATVPPQTLFPPADTFRVAGAAVEHGVAAPRAVAVRAAPDYLETLQLPLLEGRFFDRGDHAAATPVAAVSRTLAMTRFADRGAVGEFIILNGVQRRIIGVAADARQSIIAPAGAFEETIYTPLAERPPRVAYLLIRTRGEPTAADVPIRRVLRDIDADITIHSVETLEQYAGRYLVGIDIFSTILSLFGGFALLLATLGIYGLVAYAVRQRSHEIGVRRVVGARAVQVVGMLALHGARAAAAGLLLGLVLLLPLLALVSRVLDGFGLAPVRPLTIAATGMLLLATAFLACVLPASRAARIDPVRVLRAE